MQLYYYILASVAKIPDNALHDCRTLTQLLSTEGGTDLGYNMFTASILTSVVISNTVTNILGLCNLLLYQ